jgi:hypothetical protein
LVGRLTNWSSAATSLTIKVQETVPNLTSAYAFDVSSTTNYSSAYAAQLLSGLASISSYVGSDGRNDYSGLASISSYVGSDGRNDYFVAGTSSSVFIAGGGDDVAFVADSAVRDRSGLPVSYAGFVNVSMLHWDSDLPAGLSQSKFTLSSPGLTPTQPGLLQVIYEGGSGAFFTDAETILLQDAAGQTRSGFKLNAVAGGLELQLTDDADYLVNSSNQDLVKAGAGDDIVWATGRDVAVPSDAPAPRLAVTEVMPSVQGGAGDDILLAGQAGQGVRQGVDAGTQLTSVANIEGGSGDDTLVAVSGTVYATGNTGRDSFALFSDSRNVQLVIKDFNATTDVIDLSALVRNASGALSSDQLAQRKAALLSEVLSSLEGQTQTQAVELNVSEWLDPLSEATVAKISVEFANSPDVSTVLTSHNFVLDPPSWRDLDPLVNNVA